MMQTTKTTAKTTTNTNTNTKAENDLTLVGGVWENRSAKGAVYFSLKIDQGKSLTHLDKILIFANNNKKNDKSPDLYVFVKTPL